MSSTAEKKKSDRPSKRISGTLSKEEVDAVRKSFQESLEKASSQSAEAEKLCKEFKKKMRSPSVVDIAIELEEEKIST